MDFMAMIRSKERELHDIHDLRCASLERLVSERDALLLEHSQRFDQLKEDFAYNLALIEARDAEIARLEKVVDSQAAMFADLEREHKNLAEKADLTINHLRERESALLKEKADQKVIFMWCFLLLLFDYFLDCFFDFILLLFL